MSQEKDNPRLAEIHWEGDSREVLAGFPEDVRQDLQAAKERLARVRRRIEEQRKYAKHSRE